MVPSVLRRCSRWLLVVGLVMLFRHFLVCLVSVTACSTTAVLEVGFMRFRKPAMATSIEHIEEESTSHSESNRILWGKRWRGSADAAVCEFVVWSACRASIRGSQAQVTLRKCVVQEGAHTGLSSGKKGPTRCTGTYYVRTLGIHLI